MTTRRAILFGALAILVLQGADWGTTYYVLHHGGHEVNPLSAWLIQGGWVRLALVKGAIAAVIVALALKVHQRHFGFLVRMVAALYGFIVLSNCAQVAVALTR